MWKSWFNKFLPQESKHIMVYNIIGVIVREILLDLELGLELETSSKVTLMICSCSVYTAKLLFHQSLHALHYDSNSDYIMVTVQCKVVTCYLSVAMLHAIGSSVTVLLAVNRDDYTVTVQLPYRPSHWVFTVQRRYIDWWNMSFALCLSCMVLLQIQILKIPHKQTLKCSFSNLQ